MSWIHIHESPNVNFRIHEIGRIQALVPFTPGDTEKPTDKKGRSTCSFSVLFISSIRPSPPWTHEPQQMHRDREIQRNELPFFHNLTNVTYRNQGCLLVKRFDARRFRNFSMLALLCWCLLYVVVNLFHCKMSKASEMQFFVQKGEAVDSVWLVGCIAIMSPLHDTETPQSYVVYTLYDKR